MSSNVCSIMVWAGIMINGRMRLHVVANGTMTGQRYIDESSTSSCSRLFSGAVGDKFVFMDDNCNMSSNTRCSGLSRHRWYSTSRMASAFLRSKPQQKCVGCFEEQVAEVRNYPPTNKNTLIHCAH
ncbi:hypothetical protein TNCV_4027661 [Trichonephila clavipes]|nr:hypothetical protein TNCV_4027661 [Trichonephila clavipes]